MEASLIVGPLVFHSTMDRLQDLAKHGLTTGGKQLRPCVRMLPFRPDDARGQKRVLDGADLEALVSPAMCLSNRIRLYVDGQGDVLSFEDIPPKFLAKGFRLTVSGARGDRIHRSFVFGQALAQGRA